MMRFFPVFVTALLVLGAALAQDPIFSPESIIVNPLPSFSVDVSVDKDPSGVFAPVYQVGEPIQIEVRVSEDAYVYLFSIGETGQITQLLPNRFEPDNFLSANQRWVFPGPGARYGFTVSPPEGLEKVLAVASKTPVYTGQLVNFRSDDDFATSDVGQDRFAEGLSIVVEPVPSSDWVTDTALLYVGSSQPTPAAPASLLVDSNPAGAEVFLDHRLVGLTPLSLDLGSGSYSLELRLAGYRNYTTTVELFSGETRVVRAALALDAEILFDHPRLLAYPGSTLTRFRDRDGKLEAEFETVSGLEQVYLHFHRQLEAEGWRRSNFELKRNEAKADYRRGGEAFKLELKRRGGSGGFQLKIDFDGRGDDDD